MGEGASTSCATCGGLRASDEGRPGEDLLRLRPPSLCRSTAGDRAWDCGAPPVALPTHSVMRWMAWGRADGHCVDVMRNGWCSSAELSRSSPFAELRMPARLDGTRSAACL